jgi:hypothetical protein
MKPLHATQVVSASEVFLAANALLLPIPGNGRNREGSLATNQDVIIYSITFAVSGCPGVSEYGFIVYGKQGDDLAIFTARDTCPADTGATIHATFPNGLVCRSAQEGGTNLAVNTPGLAILSHPAPNSFNASINSDTAAGPGVEVFFGADTPLIYQLTVTYGYLPQAELQQ